MQVFIQSIVNGLGDSSLYVMLALGLTLLFGVLRVVNFAQGDFMTIAAYVGLFAVVMLGGSPLLALVVMIPTGAALGAGLYFFILRPTERGTPERRLLATFGLSLFLQGLIGVVFGVDDVAARQNAGAFHVDGIVFTSDFIRNFLVAAIAVGLVFAMLNLTRVGREIRAVAQDATGAALSGINVGRIRLIAAVIACALTGVGGLMLLTTSYIYPQAGSELVLTGFAVVVLGGLGSVGGAVIGSLVIGLSTQFVTSYINPVYADVVPFLAIVITLMVRPQGLSRKAIRT